MLSAILAASIATAVVRDGRVVSIENPDAVFRMASLSKVVTAYAVRQLRVDLHADISTYLGDLPMHRYNGAKITLHHLLTHTSGIEDAFFGNVVPLGQHVPTLEEHFRARPPTFARPPGGQVLYSNEGMALAGLVVERVSGLPFSEYARTRIFAPLGMHSSTFEQPPRLRVVPSGAEHEALIQAPSGAMVSTVGDMAKLMLALLAEGVPYGMFAGEIGGRPGFFHTGRSGHESVLYLVPNERLGIFLVHDGADRTLRRRYVESILGNVPLQPRDVHIADGTYRPILLPVTRIEKAGELAADTSFHSNRLRLPPFALGQTIIFTRGVSRDGYRITVNGDRFTLTGPLTDPVTFVRIPWWMSGRAQLLAFAFALLTIIVAIFRARGAPRIALIVVIAFLIAAPLAFAAMYFPRDAESRPFHVASSINAAVAMLLCAATAALIAAWIARRHWLASVACIAVVLALFHWNLLRFVGVG